MTWNANIPATNAALLSAPLRENFQALDTSFYAPLTAATDGYLLYRAAGPTVSGEANLLWDATNNNLKLFGGGVGTSGNGVLALGPSTTTPTTSPVDTVQFYTRDYGGEAGSRILGIRDERGGVMEMGSHSSGLYLRQITSTCETQLKTLPAAGYIGTVTAHELDLMTSNAVRLKLTATGNAEFYGTSTGVNLKLDATANGGQNWVFDSAGTGSGYRGAGCWSLIQASGYGEMMSFALNSDWYVNFSGLGVRKVTYGTVDSAGAGYRQVRMAN
jgi:hypothetical protein